MVTKAMAVERSVRKLARLFAAERDQRIDACRASGRPVAGREGDALVFVDTQVRKAVGVQAVQWGVLTMDSSGKHDLASL